MHRALGADKWLVHCLGTGGDLSLCEDWNVQGVTLWLKDHIFFAPYPYQSLNERISFISPSVIFFASGNDKTAKYAVAQYLPND